MYVGMYMLMMLKPTKMMSLCPLPVIAARRTAAVPPPGPPCRRPEGGRRAAAVPLPPVAARRAAAAARRAAAVFFLRLCRGSMSQTMGLLAPLYRKSAPNEGRGHPKLGDHAGPGEEALGQIAKKGPRRGNVTLLGL